MLWFKLDDGSNPDLEDFRANFKNTWGQALLFQGGANGSTGEATANRWKQVNLAGVFINAGANLQSGVMDVWIDPDRTVVMDPFVRAQGWDGAVATTYAGRDIGCMDYNRSTPRNGPAILGNYMRKVTGGVTGEYGQFGVNFFATKYFGNSDTDRFLVRVKDYGSSGPTWMTGLPAGVAVKLGTTAGLMKNDPAATFGSITAADKRWIRFQQLPSTYGNGMYSFGIDEPCADGNLTSNSFASGTPFIWLAEASSDSNPTTYQNAYFNVKFSGNWDFLSANSTRRYVGGAGSGQDYQSGEDAVDRTWGHVLSIDSGATMVGLVDVLDTGTITGPGTWSNVKIERVQIDQNSNDYICPNDNTVTDTRIAGVVTVGTCATNTVISNVQFTGSARAIITIGDGSDVTVGDLCAPAGSTITATGTGTGTLTYEGSSQSLPFTISTDPNECSISENERPDPPGIP
jgi:hypothetical protein